MLYNVREISSSLSIQLWPREINVFVILCDFSELNLDQMNWKKSVHPNTPTSFFHNFSNSDSNNDYGRTELPLICARLSHYLERPSPLSEKFLTIQHTEIWYAQVPKSFDSKIFWKTLWEIHADGFSELLWSVLSLLCKHFMM